MRDRICPGNGTLGVGQQPDHIVVAEAAVGAIYEGIVAKTAISANCVTETCNDVSREPIPLCAHADKLTEADIDGVQKAGYCNCR